MIEKFLEYLLYHWQNRESLKTLGGLRSPEWSRVRKEFLKTHLTCEACGRDKYLQIHHIKSFATEPSLELNPQNFIVLCEGMESNCHRMIGHLQNYKSINETVREDATYWLKKIKNRPSWDGKNWIYPKII